MSSNGTQVFVGNLPDSCQNDSLRDLFSPYGEIRELSLKKNFAFVNFVYKEDANKVVKDLHKSKMFGRELTVEIAKSKNRSSVANRGSGGDKRDDNRRKSSGLAVPSSGFHPSAHGGGILGVAPNANLPNLLSAVNNVVAAATSGRPAPEMFERNDQQHSGNRDRDLSMSHNPPSSLDPHLRKNLADGYVIYERYYADPKHPLLKGLPIPELPRVTDSYVSQDVSRNRDYYSSRQEDHSANDYRERSPLQNRRNFDYDRQHSNDYNNSYFDRR